MKKKAWDIIMRMNRGEIPSTEDLDTMHVCLNPDENVGRRRLLQDRYDFLRPTSIRKGLMAFGFECGDGWLPILEELFEGFQKLVDKRDDTSFKVEQVKQKYGTLRVYHNGGDEYEALVDRAEAMSEFTCEVCGQQGMMRDDGWMMVRCDRCYKGKK